jgi:hypothetical protein
MSRSKVLPFARTLPAIPFIMLAILDIYSCRPTEALLWASIAVLEILGISASGRPVEGFIKLEKHSLTCGPGERVRILAKINDGDLEERNFKVFIDGNEVEIEGFRDSGSNYELEIRAPSEVGSHSAIVEVRAGLKHDFDSLEILVTGEGG